MDKSTFDAAKKQTWKKLATLENVVFENIRTIEKRKYEKYYDEHKKELDVDKPTFIKIMEESCSYSYKNSFDRIKELRKIQNITENALKEAAKNKLFFREEGINWASLYCINVEYYIDIYGDIGYNVYIEEAAPDCNNLRAYIKDYLDEHGIKDVTVITEW